MNYYSTIKYSQGTKVMLGVDIYIVTACVDLAWITGGESTGYHLQLKLIS